MVNYKKQGRSNHRKGADAERELAKKLATAFPGHNFTRIGGPEANKWSMKGDIRCVVFSKFGEKVCAHEPCEWQGYYIEVKNQKGQLKDGRVSEVQSDHWLRKAFDDAGNDIPILFYKEPGAKWYVKTTQYSRTFNEWATAWISQTQE